MSPLPEGWRFADLTSNPRAATRLFERGIRGLHRLSSPNDGIENGRRQWYLPGDPRGLDIWVGVKDSAGRVQAAIHIAPGWGYLDEFSTMPRASRPPREWTTKFVQTSRAIHDFAVAEETRGLGVGRALERHAAAIAYSTGCTHLHGFTSELDCAQDFFASCGYTVLPKDTAPPSEVVHGLPIKHSAAISGPGWWFYRAIESPGSDQ